MLLFSLAARTAGSGSNRAGVADGGKMRGYCLDRARRSCFALPEGCLAIYVTGYRATCQVIYVSDVDPAKWTGKKLACGAIGARSY